MALILIIVFAVLLMSPVLRCALFKLSFVIFYGLRDGVQYITRKKSNEASYGDVRMYIAHSNQSFGCGKTLTAVQVACMLYKRFNGVKVWCRDRKKFVTQRIHIISNVTLKTIPFEKLVDLKQFVQRVNDNYVQDMENDTLTVTYLIVDEAGAQFNSRAFKSNFDALFIKTLLTSRHFRASIVMTSQRQSMVDALMRQITNVVVSCSKTWRFEMLRYYDGYEIETAQNPALVAPYRRSCWFIRDKDFAAYDTFELVGDLQKSCETGDRLSEEEILALQCNEPSNPDAVLKNSRRWLRNRKKSR